MRITDILVGGAKPKAATKTAPKKADAKPAEKPAAKKAAPKAAAAAGAVAAGALFAAQDGEPDDLKQISGVGPVLEKKLHGLGITKFAQVAAFTADDIAKVDDALSFKGRIERDNWLEQAAELAKAAKYETDKWLIKKQAVHPVTVATQLVVVLALKSLVASLSFQATLLRVNAARSGTRATMSAWAKTCLLYTSPSPRDQRGSRMPSSA